MIKMDNIYPCYIIWLLIYSWPTLLLVPSLAPSLTKKFTPSLIPNILLIKTIFQNPTHTLGVLIKVIFQNPTHTLGVLIKVIFQNPTHTLEVLIKAIFQNPTHTLGVLYSKTLRALAKMPEDYSYRNINFLRISSYFYQFFFIIISIIEGFSFLILKQKHIYFV